MEQDIGIRGSPVFALFEKLVKGQTMPEDKKEFSEWLDLRLREHEEKSLPAMHIKEIVGEEDFEKKLKENKDKLLIIKYWKHRCLPCLAYGPFMKEAEETLKKDHPRCEVLSVDIKRPENLKLAAWQRVMGTPTVQYYYQGRQVGENVEQLGYRPFVDHIKKTLQFLSLAPAERWAWAQGSPDE